LFAKWPDAPRTDGKAEPLVEPYLNPVATPTERSSLSRRLPLRLRAGVGTAAAATLSVPPGSYGQELTTGSPPMLVLEMLTALALQQAAAPPQISPSPAIDSAGLRHANGRTPPMLVAARTAGATPRIDGRLDDAVWAAAEPASRFTQYSPRNGEPPSESTVVRVAYDDEAIYVAARMFDSRPSRIAAQLGRRDDLGDSDYFEVDFDSYHDHRTSFLFHVNPLGVKRDVAASNDFSSGDSGWDPVWEAATSRDSLGWTAEFRIPLSQLRFPNASSQLWGINFYRYIYRSGESDFWSNWSQTDEGYASLFGHLVGLESLPQPRRIELLPYATGIEERLTSGRADNPFNDGSREVGRAGLDLKYGLTSNLTLNATVNPDFGQVEADPAEVNLTAYETYFSERRPFFVEGADIFRTTSPGLIPVSGAQFLYSRRIGRSPQGSANARTGFVDQPTSSTILGAAKLSGRTAGGWVLGLLDAVTAREFATVDSAGVRFRDQVEPTTNYAVVRAKRDFGGGASSVGLMGTAVNRRIDDDRLAFLRTAAYAGGVDFSHRFSRGRYSFFAALGYSSIQGDTLAIRAAQRSSARYYQRPDAEHTDYDPTRTSLAGWNASLGFSKDQGSTPYALGFSATSPGFEINDLGYQTRADRVTASFLTRHRWTRPGRVFRYASVETSGSFAWNFGGDRTATSVSASAYGQFLSFWTINAGLTRGFRAVSDDLLRGGPAGMTPGSWSLYGSLVSDYRKPVRAYVGYTRSHNELAGWGDYLYTQLLLRPTPTISISTGPSYSVSLRPQQYVTSVTDSSASATMGRRYLFAEILQHSLDLTTRLDVTLSATLSVQLYVQPFVATGDYRRLKELTAPRTTDYLVYGETPGSSQTPVTDSDGNVTAFDLDPDGTGPRPVVQIGNYDFSSRSLRANAVLRWEYRPGSTLFLVWTSSCSAYDPQPVFSAGDDLRHLCHGRGNNVFAVNMNYWLSL